MSPVSPTDPSNLIDPSLYQRVGFVVRSNVSKKTESIAELNLALHTLRAVWEAHCLPTDKQVMRYKSTDFLDIRLYRHEKSSLLQPGLDHGLLRLQSVLSREHSALVIAGIDGISNDTEELSQYLLSFKEDTMLYFFMGGKLEYKFTSKQLASELQVDPRNLFQSKSDVAMRLNMTKMAEHMYVQVLALKKICLH